MRWLGLLAVVCMTACTAHHAASTGQPLPAREQQVRERVSRAVYSRPLGEVWEQARQLLRDEGYRFQEALDDYELVTDWRQGVGTGSGPAWVRILVRGEELPSGECTVRAVRLELTGGQTHPDTHRRLHPMAMYVLDAPAMDVVRAGMHETVLRDLGLEHRLLQRVNPALAARLDSPRAR